MTFKVPEVILALCLSFSCGYEPLFAQETIYELKQEITGYSFGSGKATVHVNSGKYLMKWDVDPATLFISSPAYDVCTFNDWHADRVPFRSFVANAATHGADRFFMRDGLFCPMKRGTVAGLKATYYEIFPPPGGKLPVDTASSVTITAWLADDIPVSKETSKVLSIIYGAPDEERALLEVTISKGGKVLRQIKTSSQKKSPVDPKMFVLPKRSPGKVLAPTLFWDRDPAPDSIRSQ